MSNRADKYDEAFEIVVAMAKVKMLMNAHKGDIEKVDTSDLIIWGQEEFDELRQAINEGSYTHIVEEVADILNFAVAAAYNAIQSYRTRKNVENTGHTESRIGPALDGSKDRRLPISGGAQLQRGDDCEGHCEDCGCP